MVEPSRLVEAAVALPELAAEPVALLRSASGLFIRYRTHHVVAAEAADSDTSYRESAKREHTSMIALPEVRARAAALGFRYLGGYEYLATFGFTQRDLWVSEDGTTRLSGRDGNAKGVAAMMSPYILSTVFDDRTSIVTWGKGSPIGPSPRVDSRAGTGNLDRDATSHFEAVEAYLEAHPKVHALRPTTVEDANALSRYFDVHLAPDSVHSANLNVRLIVYGAVAVLGWAVLTMIVRMAHAY